MSIQMPSKPIRLVSSKIDGSVRCSVVSSTGSLRDSFALTMLWRIIPPRRLHRCRRTCFNLCDETFDVCTLPRPVEHSQRRSWRADVDIILDAHGRTQEGPNRLGTQNFGDRA